jgi:hypothetical protein
MTPPRLLFSRHSSCSSARFLLGRSPGPEVLAQLERAERSVAGVGNVRELRVEFGGPDTVHARMHVAKWHRRHLDVDTPAVRNGATLSGGTRPATAARLRSGTSATQNTDVRYLASVSRTPYATFPSIPIRLPVELEESGHDRRFHFDAAPHYVFLECPTVSRMRV